MNYKIMFDLTFFNGSRITEDVKIETKGKGKKVLRAKIKEYIEYFYNMQENVVEVTPLSIIRYDTLNFNNVWPKEDFEKFKNKCYYKKQKEKYVVH